MNGAKGLFLAQRCERGEVHGICGAYRDHLANDIHDKLRAGWYIQLHCSIETSQL